METSMDGSYQALLLSIESTSYEQCKPEDKSSWENVFFPTFDSARLFYESYARKTGFKSRIEKREKINSKGKKTEVFHYMHYVCNKRGYRKGSALNPSNQFTVGSIEGAEMEKDREKKESRCGCMAEIRFKLVDDIGCYKITQWLWEHNHQLHPESHSHLLERKIDPIQAVVAEANAGVGISIRQSYELLGRVAGGSNNLGFTPIDLKNHLLTKRQIALEVGEGTSLLEYFRKEALTKPNFFYSVQVDADEEIASIFWSDGFMRSDYHSFGDVVSFDTTFSTNNLYRPLAAFIGFNHHRELCVFASALLLNEMAETFAWLFKTFLECMSGKLPSSFFTDQCAAIRCAVNAVMPSSVFHGLCSWHITENAKKNLGFYADSKFLEEFHFLINEIDSPSEFDFNWEKMVLRCFQGKNEEQITWLGFIRDFKEQWCSAWVKDHFTAGLKSTQLSESFNALVKKYIKYTSSLTEFFERFNKMVTRLRDIEITSNFNAIEYFPKNHFPHSTIMQHASEVYSPTIFNKIHQEFELIHGYYYDHLRSMDSGSSKSFSVFRLLDPLDFNTKIDERVVTIDFEEIELSCSCRLFNNWGFFCRHIFKVMEMASSSGHHPRLRIIPDSYILKRWTRLAKGGLEIYNDVPVSISNPQSNGAAYEQRYQQVCIYMNFIASRVCMFDKPYEVFLNDIIEAGRRAEGLIQSLGPSPTTNSTVKSKAKLDHLAKGVKPAASRKKTHKRIKTIVEKVWKKRACRKKEYDERTKKKVQSSIQEGNDEV